MTLQKDFLRDNNLGLLLLRLTVGGLMLFHGLHKLFYGVGFIGGMLSQMGLPTWIAYGSLLGEVVASLMLIAGLWTRAAAIVFAGNMVVAILMAHIGQLFAIDPRTGGWVPELPMLYLMGGVVLFFTGGGRYALTRGGIAD